MAKYYKYVQPTLVKTSEYDELPQDLKKKYFININIVGIPYFVENFMLTEQNGQFYLQQEDGRELELEVSTDSEVIDVPRVYLQLTDNFTQDESNFFDFISQAIPDNYIYLTGTDNFKPGEDYLINEVLYNYLKSKYTDEKSQFFVEDTDIDVDHFVIGNYIDSNVNITQWFTELSEKEQQYINYEYYKKKNDSLNNTFSEDDLNSFSKTFCKIILELTEISEDKLSTINNQIYKQVLTYYANGGYDCASVGLNLILGSSYGTSTTTSLSNSTCSCNSSVTDTVYNTESCASMYDSGMKLYLKQMLGDSQFYKDWFNIDLDDDSYFVNDNLCDMLITLINEFLALVDLYNYDLGQQTSITHGCCSEDLNITSSCNQYSIIDNYRKILEIVKNDQIDSNQNKIKVYGQQFGSILPSLNF